MKVIKMKIKAWNGDNQSKDQKHGNLYVSH